MSGVSVICQNRLNQSISWRITHPLKECFIKHFISCVTVVSIYMYLQFAIYFHPYLHSMVTVRIHQVALYIDDQFNIHVPAYLQYLSYLVRGLIIYTFLYVFELIIKKYSPSAVSSRNSLKLKNPMGSNKDSNNTNNVLSKTDVALIKIDLLSFISMGRFEINCRAVGNANVPVVDNVLSTTCKFNAIDKRNSHGKFPFQL